MACFTLAWALSLCIWIIVIAAVVTIIRAVVPWLLGLMGGGIPAPVLTIINVVLWAVVAIAVVIMVFDLLSCVTGGGFLSLPHR